MGWHMPGKQRNRSHTGTSSTSRTQPYSMSMSTSQHHLRHAQQLLRQIAAEWPADPLRPNLQLKTFFAALADHPALSARAVAATRALHRNQVSDRVSSFDALFSNGPCKKNYYPRPLLHNRCWNPLRCRCTTFGLKRVMRRRSKVSGDLGGKFSLAYGSESVISRVTVP